MAISEQTIRTTARMYEMRDTAKRLLGAKYTETMTQCREILEANAKRYGDRAMDALLRLMKAAESDPSSGYAKVYLTAAFVEMAEPGS